MKPLCFLLLLNILFSTAFAQSKTERYCWLKVIGNMGKDNVQLQVSLGQNDSLFAFKDTTIITRLKKVEQITSYEDGFNYLASLGWSVALPPTPVAVPWRGAIVYCFRRTFDASELR
jgi:hypothetical protein